jgi:hypothetical protein
VNSLRRQLISAQIVPLDALGFCPRDARFRDVAGGVGSPGPSKGAVPHNSQPVASLAPVAVTLRADGDALVLAGAIASPRGVGEYFTHASIDALNPGEPFAAGP